MQRLRLTVILVLVRKHLGPGLEGVGKGKFPPPPPPLPISNTPLLGWGVGGKGVRRGFLLGFKPVSRRKIKQLRDFSSEVQILCKEGLLPLRSDGTI